MATTQTDPSSPAAESRTGDRPARTPWRRLATPWMALQSLVVAVVHLAGDFGPIRRVDSALYIELAREASPERLLGSIRTPGYPLLLRSVDGIWGDFGHLPAIQLAVYLAAVVGLCALLEKRGLSPIAAFAATTPLLYVSLVRHLAPSIMTDIPSVALALTCCILVLWRIEATERPASVGWRRWILPAFGLCFTACWLLRPSYVFLLAFLPAAALWMPAGSDRVRWLPGRDRLRLAAWVMVIGLVPLLAYSGLRWSRVGHFAPASFGGHNLVGVAGSLVAAERVESMPPGDRDLARWILSQRPLRHIEPFDAGTPFTAWERAHNKNSWRISVPYLRARWKELPIGPDGTRTGKIPQSVWVDRYLASWSSRTIRGRLGLYSVWLVRACGAATRRTLENPWIWGSGIATLLALCAYLWRQPANRTLPCGARTARAWLGFASGYLLVSLALVLPMQPPRWRYLAAATLLLPGALLAMAIELAVAARRSADDEPIEP